jgi:toxin ParE1/3/4
VKFRDLFQKLYERLADHPDSGAPRPTLGQNVRIGVVAPYIVIYRHDETNGIVNVLRIVHGRRRITAKMIAD